MLQAQGLINHASMKMIRKLMSHRYIVRPNLQQTPQVLIMTAPLSRQMAIRTDLKRTCKLWYMH